MKIAVLAVVSAAAAWGQCTYQITVTGATSIDASGNNRGTITVTAANNCSWTYSTEASWLSFPVGPPRGQGSGNGSVGWSAERNPTGSQRTGVIKVADKTVTITQAGQNCSASAVGNTTVPVLVTGGSGTFQINTNCTWQAATSSPWLTVTGSGDVSGVINFTAAANACVADRTGTITAANLAYIVNQSGSEANLTLTPNQATVAAAGGDGTFAVTTGAGCSWTASSNASWLQVLPTIGGVVNYRAQANTTTQTRTALIAVFPKTFLVTQPAAAPLPVKITGIVNSANYAPPPVVPGEVVTIYGEQFGPAEVVGAELAADGRSITKTLSGTRVLFDGVAAAMIYSWAGQVSAVVPYGVAGLRTTSVQVEYNGTRSAAFPVAVGTVSPAIFTLDQSGTGPGAIRNQDYSINGASNPVPRGGVILIYCTGTGVTLPASVDAQLTTGPDFPRVALPVLVTIGGADAKVLYAGGTPDSVAGLTQINAEIPLGIVPGDKVPVQIRVGDADSTSGVTVAVN